jgi:hypothetical protein
MILHTSSNLKKATKEISTCMGNFNCLLYLKNAILDSLNYDKYSDWTLFYEGMEFLKFKNSINTKFLKLTFSDNSSVYIPYWILMKRASA